VVITTKIKNISSATIESHLQTSAVYDFSRIFLCLTFDPRNEAVIRDTLNFGFFMDALLEYINFRFKKMVNGIGRELFLQ
jgi:hypothetical protein